MFLPEKDLHGICPECNKKVTYRSKGVECECCLNWYHVKSGDISDDLKCFKMLHNSGYIISVIFVKF